MNDDEIKRIVKEFLETQPIRFSPVWEKDLFTRLKRVREKNIRVLVKTVHDNMIQEIKETCKRRLLAGFPKADADDILQEALISWIRSNFDGTIATETGHPELAALWQQVRWRNMDANDEASKLNTVGYRENSYDKPDESDEANISSDDLFSDENDSTVESESSDEGIESGEVNKNYHEEVVENLPAETEPEPTKEKNKCPFVYINEKRFTAFAAEEAITFYKLAKRKYELRFHQPSRKHQIFKPVRKTIEDETRKEFQHLEFSTRHYKERFNFLKNAERRTWMEVAIKEMKKSREKLDLFIVDAILKKQILLAVKNDISCDAEFLKGLKVTLYELKRKIVFLKQQGFLVKEKKGKFSSLKLKDENPKILKFEEKEFRQHKPLLSAVAVDRNFNRIATCFKGGVDFKYNGTDKTWDLHCEYALFKHVIKDDNIHLLKEGTLYVTLEPCNKRGYWLDGEVEKPKIPCAVRCVQSGAKTVYVGTPDDNPEVYMQGFEILSKGKFTFKLKNGKHIGNVEEIKAAELLESYFRDTEKYPSEKFADKTVYKVGEPLNAIQFDDDLMEVVRSINSTFLQRHNKEAFI